MNVKACLFAAVASSLFAAPARAQMQPGTIKLLSKSVPYVDATTNDTYVEITDLQPAKFLVIGPEMLQGYVRVNLAPGEAQGAPVLVTVLAARREVARYRITPRAGPEKWRGRTDVVPSLAIGFYAQLDPGPQAYEFRVQGATKGAALFLTTKSKARAPLAANAPVIPPRPATVAAPAATPTPSSGVTGTGIAIATPAPAATPLASVRTLDQIRTTARPDKLVKQRRSYEASLKLGFALPRYEEFTGTGVVGAEARWALGLRKSYAVGVEAAQLSYSALLPDDPARGTAPSALDLNLIPIAVNGTWLPPVDGRFQPYVGAGPVIAVGSSVTRTAQVDSIPDSALGFGAQAMAGIQYDMLGSEFQEGSNKVFVEAKGSFLQVPFTEHIYTDWSSFQVLGGVSLKF